MAIFIGDSEYFGNSWADQTTRELFSDRALLGRWLKVLGALAEAQAGLDMIPLAAAQEIKRLTQIENFPFDRLRAHFEETRHSTAGIIKLFNELAPKAAADYFYFGATVQDISDTATSLMLKEVQTKIFLDLRETSDLLKKLTFKHRATYMLGRTHGQSGSVITFGFKCASYFAELERNMKRLESCFNDCAVVQLAGSVGSLSAWGDLSFALREKFAGILGLSEPAMSWTNSRDNLLSLVHGIHLVSMTMSRLANEIYNLQRSGIEEVFESTERSYVHSITMPHKCNPELAEHVGTLANFINGLVSSLADGAVHEHERDGKNWKTEWSTLPLLLSTFSIELKTGNKILGGLRVDDAKMRKNIEETRGHCFSESLLFAMAKKIGLIDARKKISGLYAQPGAVQKELRQLAKQAFPEILSDLELDDIFSAERAAKNCEKMAEAIGTSRGFGK